MGILGVTFIHILQRIIFINFINEQESVQMQILIGMVIRLNFIS